MANNVHAQATSTSVLDVPVIAPGHDFETVTEAVAQIPLSKRTPLGWVFGFLIGLALLGALQMALGKLVLTGIGIWGINVPVGWGFDIINFVWWIGIGHAGHADLRHPAAVPAGLAHVDQPLRRGDDLFAVACAAIFPLFHTGRPWLAAYWLLPYPEHHGAVAAVPQPAHLGRVRGHHLRDGLDRVLVRRHDARHGDDARPGRLVGQAQGLRHPVARLARVGPSLAPLRGGLAAARRSVHAAGAVGAHRGELRLRGLGAARLARHHLPAVLRGRRHLRRLRDGADAGDSAARRLQARGLHHDAPHRQHGQGHAGDGPDRGLRLRDGGVLRLVQREPVRALHDLEPHDRPLCLVVLDADCHATPG
jgi:hypothetical protein